MVAFSRSLCSAAFGAIAEIDTVAARGPHKRKRPLTTYISIQPCYHCAVYHAPMGVQRPFAKLFTHDGSPGWIRVSENTSLLGISVSSGNSNP